MKRKIVIVAIVVVVVAMAIILPTLIWTDIKSRELWSTNPELFVKISDLKYDFYRCGIVGAGVSQGQYYRGGFAAYRVNVTITVSNRGYGDVIVTVNVSTVWSINAESFCDRDVKDVFVKAHSSATVIANVTVGINPRFEEHNEEIVKVRPL